MSLPKFGEEPFFLQKFLYVSDLGEGANKPARAPIAAEHKATRISGGVLSMTTNAILPKAPRTTVSPRTITTIL